MKTLMAIGGAADVEEPVIFEEFIRRAGGVKAKIVILPQASGLKNTGLEYQKIFQKLGVKVKPVSLEFRERKSAGEPEYLKALKNAGGVFIAGGTQMRLTTLIGGTAFETELLKSYERGTVIAGTSAGTAVQSRVMIAYGDSGSTPREGMARLSAGIGFTDRIIFDQHFSQRNRVGRLAYAVCMHPGMLGVGVDENTCAIVEDDCRIVILGQGGVTILDGKEMDSTNVAEVEDGKPVAFSPLTLHVLTHGCWFDMQTRKAHIAPLALA